LQAAAQAQQQQKDGDGKKAPAASANQPSKEGASKAAAAATAKQSKHTPIKFTGKPAAEATKPLTAHEKALQVRNGLSQSAM